MKISIENVSKSFGKTLVLDRVNLTIEEGELFFLLGPSGCGKTTLLRILAGFLEPDQGAVFFDDQNMAGVAPEKRGTGMVFQNYALWPHMTVFENVAFGLEVLGLSKAEIQQRVQEMLRVVKMDGYEQRRPAELSGGQQQRVAVARAMVIQPGLILLDEPLSNLDARLRAEMRMELREIIKQSGRTAVYVTHDQREALSMADRCAILSNGWLHQIGTPHELYIHPVDPFVATFFGDANFVEGEILSCSPNSKAEVQLMGVSAPLEGIWHQPHVPGEKVLCCIRPEAFTIHAMENDGPNSIPVQLIHSVFMGESTIHTCEIAGQSSTRLSVLELHTPPRPCGRYNLKVRPEDLLIMKRSGHAS